MSMSTGDLASARVAIVGDAIAETWIASLRVGARGDELCRMIKQRWQTKIGGIGRAKEMLRAILVPALAMQIDQQLSANWSTRILGDSNKVMLRLDAVNASSVSDAARVAARAAAKSAHRSSKLTAIYAVDRGAGFFNANEAMRWVRLADDLDVPLIVDPRSDSPGWGWWDGATIIKARETKARAAAQGRGSHKYVTTRGMRGWSLHGFGQAVHRESVATTVRITAGAGEAFGAVLSAAIRSREPERDEVIAACEIANAAAAWWVSRDPFWVPEPAAKVKKEIDRLCRLGRNRQGR